MCLPNYFYTSLTSLFTLKRFLTTLKLFSYLVPQLHYDKAHYPSLLSQQSLKFYQFNLVSTRIISPKYSLYYYSSFQVDLAYFLIFKFHLSIIKYLLLIDQYLMRDFSFLLQLYHLDLPTQILTIQFLLMQLLTTKTTPSSLFLIILFNAQSTYKFTSLDRFHPTHSTFSKPKQLLQQNYSKFNQITLSTFPQNL